MFRGSLPILFGPATPVLPSPFPPPRLGHPSLIRYNPSFHRIALRIVDGVDAMTILHVVGFVVAVALIVVMLLDCFEAIIVPRRVTRPYRYARLYYRNAWLGWRWGAKHLFRSSKHRQTYLSLFGPISLLILFASWGIGLIVGFGLLLWSLEVPLQVTQGNGSLEVYLYLSGTTFFTLGYGDVTPTGSVGRVLAVVEAGLGFSFLAVVIGYLPVFYQALARREVLISMLDARAGSPPTAGEALRRAAQCRDLSGLPALLAEGERWAAEVLESHLSYPVLSYYRSQHDNQSWVAAMTALLDTSALLIAGWKGSSSYQARLTFAMARHVVVDLALVFQLRPQPAPADRLPDAALGQLLAGLRAQGVEIPDEPGIATKLAELRGMYEPFLVGLAEHFLVTLPPVVPEQATVDNWQTSAWMRRTPGIGRLAQPDGKDDHFD